MTTEEPDGAAAGSLAEAWGRLPTLPPINDDDAFDLIRTVERGLARLGMREGDQVPMHAAAEVTWLHEAVARGDLRRLRLRLGGHA